jgi:glycosyltransferase involved in cell wall biosynthesis
MLSNTVYLIIPVFNEESNAGPLLDSLKGLVEKVSAEFVVKVLFVDDGSSDHTASIIEEQGRGLPCIVLKHPVNKGPGFAFGTAFEYLCNKLNHDDWVITMEGDNTSDVNTIERMLIRRKEGYDVVMASPYLYSGGFTHVNVFRMVISHIANALVKMMLGIRGIATFSCFLRLYSGAVISTMQNRYGARIIQCSGFESMVELLAKLIHLKVSISEVETTVDWSKRKGKRKMRILRTSLGYLKLFLKRSKFLASE